MSEHKSMNKVIHSALRRDLSRFESALLTFAPGERARADQLAGAWNNFSFQLHHHHRDEETIFWPLLVELGATESLMGELEAEHARMVVALDAADAAMTAFDAEPGTENVAASQAALSELDGVIRVHLEHEERDLDPIADVNTDTPQMKTAQKMVRKAHKGNAGTFFTWLLDGAGPDDKDGLRQEIPPPVLFVITRVSGREYTRRIASVWA
jgi:hemerythrin-like domain-containing protein